MKIQHKEILVKLFQKWTGETGIEVTQLAQAGSYRLYYRILGHTNSAIGVYSPEKEETKAFISFTKHFLANHINVPKLIDVDLENDCYLLHDLGNQSLFDFLNSNRIHDVPSCETLDYYKKAIEVLPRIQIEAGKTLDFSVCYPSSEFDERAMKWDLNYFKYYFLRLLKVSFNEARLEDDFDILINYLLKADNQHFMYRDFQARNIMIHENEPWFIDYQGGRHGPLQYDLASLLFQVKAALPYSFRKDMLDWYLVNLRKYKQVDEDEFVEYYYGFVLMRLMQVMGAYGFRGLLERRAHFLQSIPYAIDNLRWFLKNIEIRPILPELMQALNQLAEKNIEIPLASENDKLTVEINSFSFKKGPPIDYSGNGGGYVFDCRALPNPGRYDHYKTLSGLDEPVIQFLDREPAVAKFFQHICKLVDMSIIEYQRRGFSNLQINFGCTGGQHRSVFFANRLTHYLSENYSIIVATNHLEQTNWKQ